VAEILGELEQQGTPIDGLGWDDDELKALLGDGIEAAPQEAEEQEIADKWEVLVVVSGEEEQARAIDWIEQGGFRCQPLIS